MELVGSRRPAGLTAAAVAEKMGTSPQNIRQLEMRPVERIKVGTLLRYEAAIASCVAARRELEREIGESLIRTGAELLVAVGIE